MLFGRLSSVYSVTALRSSERTARQTPCGDAYDGAGRSESTGSRFDTGIEFYACVERRHMNVDRETIENRSTDAVFERGQNYRQKGRIQQLDRFGDLATATVRRSKLYDLTSSPP